MIFLFALIGLAISALHIVTATPLYTAGSTLLVDESKMDVFQRPSVVSDPAADNAFLESQIEVLRSDLVAREVVRQLGLADIEPPKPEGLNAWLIEHRLDLSAIKETIKTAIGLSEPQSEDVSVDREGAIASNILQTLTVKRLTGTFVISVSVTTFSPKMAQTLANAFPSAYVAVDQAAKQANTRRAINWLDDRLRELRVKSAEADQAVENFRRDRGLTGTDRGIVNSQLRQLESTATSYRNLYDSLQTRYLQAVQEQSFIGSAARIISPAALPTARSSPKTVITLAIGLVASIAAAIGVGLVMDALRNSIRTPAELENAAGLECMAVLETVSAGKGLGFLPGSKSWAEYLTHVVVKRPLLRFAEELRRLAITVRQRRTDPKQATVIGVVSIAPNEGKTTIAANFAQILAMGGSKAVLVDMDVVNPSLTRLFRPPNDAVDVLSFPERDEQVWRDPVGGIDFLTFSNQRHTSHVPREFYSDEVARSFQKLRERYEFIVLDLSPILAVADATAIKHIVDAFILVGAAGRTSGELLRETLDRYDPDRSMVIGAVLNRANPVHDPAYRNYYTEAA